MYALYFSNKLIWNSFKLWLSSNICSRVVRAARAMGQKVAVRYDGSNGSLFISILLHNSEFRIPNSEICTTTFGIRNCEVYIIWASGNN